MATRAGSRRVLRRAVSGLVITGQVITGQVITGQVITGGGVVSRGVAPSGGVVRPGGPGQVSGPGPGVIGRIARVHVVLVGGDGEQARQGPVIGVLQWLRPCLELQRPDAGDHPARGRGLGRQLNAGWRPAAGDLTARYQRGDPARLPGQVDQHGELAGRRRDPADQQGECPVLVAGLGQPVIAHVSAGRAAQPAAEHDGLGRQQVQAGVQALAAGAAAAEHGQLGEADENEVIPAGEARR